MDLMELFWNYSFRWDSGSIPSYPKAYVCLPGTHTPPLSKEVANREEHVDERELGHVERDERTPSTIIVDDYLKEEGCIPASITIWK